MRHGSRVERPLEILREVRRFACGYQETSRRDRCSAKRRATDNTPDNTEPTLCAFAGQPRVARWSVETTCVVRGKSEHCFARHHCPVGVARRSSTNDSTRQPVTRGIEAVTADGRLRVIHLRQQDVWKAGPDEVVQEELPVVRAAWPDFAEALVERVEPCRWLRRPRSRLQNGNGQRMPVNAFDDGRPDVRGELVSATRCADERERRVLRELGRASPGGVRPCPMAPLKDAFDHEGRPVGRLRQDYAVAARRDGCVVGEQRSGIDPAAAVAAEDETLAGRAGSELTRERGDVARYRPARAIAGDERVESDATERRARRDEITRHVVTEIASNEHDRGRCRPRTERALDAGHAASPRIRKATAPAIIRCLARPKPERWRLRKELAIPLEAVRRPVMRWCGHYYTIAISNAGRARARLRACLVHVPGWDDRVDRDRDCLLHEPAEGASEIPRVEVAHRHAVPVGSAPSVEQAMEHTAEYSGPLVRREPGRKRQMGQIRHAQWLTGLGHAYRRRRQRARAHAEQAERRGHTGDDRLFRRTRRPGGHARGNATFVGGVHEISDRQAVPAEQPPGELAAKTEWRQAILLLEECGQRRSGRGRRVGHVPSDCAGATVPRAADA